MRESLGQFRIYRYTCDACGKTEEVQIRGSRQVRPSAGWSHIKLEVGNGPPREADVCSSECAEAWTSGRLSDAQAELRAANTGESAS